MGQETGLIQAGNPPGLNLAPSVSTVVPNKWKT